MRALSLPAWDGRQGNEKDLMYQVVQQDFTSEK